MDWVDEGRLCRRDVLGAMGVSIAATTGCLGGNRTPPLDGDDWPQPSYDGGATNFKSGGSPPVERPVVSWTASLPGDTDSDVDVVADGSAYASGAIIDIDDGSTSKPVHCVAPELEEYDERPITDTLVGFAPTKSYDNGVLVATRVGGNAYGAVLGVTPDLESGLFGTCSDAIRWQYDPEHDSPDWGQSTLVRISNGTIVTLVGETLAALRPDDGRIVWSHTIDGDDLLTDEQFAVVQTGRDTVAVFDIESGDRRSQIPVRSGGYFEALRDGTIYYNERYVDDHPVQLRAIDVETGVTRWSFATEQAFPGEDLDDDHLWDNPLGAFAAGPDSLFGVAEGASYDVTYRGRLFSLDVTDGSLRWTLDPETTRDIYSFSDTILTATDRVLYAAGRSGALIAVDPATGELHWNVTLVETPDGSAVRDSGTATQESQTRIIRQPIVSGSQLLVPTEGSLVALEEP